MFSFIRRRFAVARPTKQDRDKFLGIVIQCRTPFDGYQRCQLFLRGGEGKSISSRARTKTASTGGSRGNATSRRL